MKRSHAGGAALVALGAVALSVGAVLAASGASGFWAFDEATGTVAEDAVGSLDGTVSGATRIADGAFGKALRLDGDDYVTIPDGASLRAPDLSLTVWVRGDPGSPPADGAVILEKGDDGCDGGSYALVVDGPHVALRYRDAEVGAMAVVSLNGNAAFPTLWDGTWHQVGFATRTDTWGYAGLWIDGWVIGSGSRGILQTGLDTADLVVGVGADPSCGQPGFVGDIDHLRVHDRTLSGAEFAADEAPRHPTFEIESVDPLATWEYGYARVRIQSGTVLPGSIRIGITPPGGTETPSPGPVRIEEWWDLPADGRFTVPVYPKHGGLNTIRIRYEPAWGADPVEDSISVDVVRAPSTSAVGVPNQDQTGEPIAIAGEPITVNTGTNTPYPIVPTGTLELYEIVDGQPQLLASAALQPPDSSSWSGSRTFTLPARAPGVVELEARYSGNADIAPSVSRRLTLTIVPALVPGPVSLDGGAATTSDPGVVVSTPAEGAIAMQVASDLVDIRRINPPIAYAPTVYTVLTAVHLGDDADGVRTIWVRWADALGRWSDWASDSIILDRGVQAGTVTINAGAAFSQSRTVTIAAPVADPSQVAAVQLSNDGTGWSEVPYASSIGWTFPADGTQTIHVRWRDLEGRQSMTKTDSIVVDSLAPVVATPRAAVRTGTTPGSTVALRLSWSATDQSGVATYDVSLRRVSGSWTTIASATKATAVNRSLTRGVDYELRVRATDIRGIRSGWKVTGIRVGSYQESSSRISYGGTWTRAASTRYWGDALRYSTRTGSTASLSTSTRSIAWVAPVGPTRGSARVYADGVLVATVSLYARTSGGPRVVFQCSWPTSGTHRLTIKVSGTSGHPRVDLDAFVVVR